jgi:hypothetical protein
MLESVIVRDAVVAVFVFGVPVAVIGEITV